MNTNYAKGLLEMAFREICESIPEGVREVFRESAYIAGGAVRDLIRGRMPKDYDIYFRTEDAMNTVTREVEWESRSKMADFRVQSSDDIWRLTLIRNYTHERTKGQLITLMYGAPEEVVQRFDFTVNTGWWCPLTGKLVYGDTRDALIYQMGGPYPLNALMRVPYLLEKGFTITKEEMVKIGVDISRMAPIRTIEQLEAACVGCSFSPSTPSGDIL